MKNYQIANIIKVGYQEPEIDITTYTEKDLRGRFTTDEVSALLNGDILSKHKEQQKAVYVEVNAHARLKQVLKEMV